jgi:hypothetical protein
VLSIAAAAYFSPRPSLCFSLSVCADFWKTCADSLLTAYLHLFYARERRFTTNLAFFCCSLARMSEKQQDKHNFYCCNSKRSNGTKRVILEFLLVVNKTLLFIYLLLKIWLKKVACFKIKRMLNEICMKVIKIDFQYNGT